MKWIVTGIISAYCARYEFASLHLKFILKITTLCSHHVICKIFSVT